MRREQLLKLTVSQTEREIADVEFLAQNGPLRLRFTETVLAKTQFPVGRSLHTINTLLPQ